MIYNGEAIKEPLYHTELSVCIIYLVYIFIAQAGSSCCSPMFLYFVQVYKVSGYILFLLCFLFLPCQFLCGLIQIPCVLNHHRQHITAVVHCRRHIGSLGVVHATESGSWKSVYLFHCPQLSLPVPEELKLDRDTSAVLLLLSSSLIFLTTYCHCYRLHVLQRHKDGIFNCKL